MQGKSFTQIQLLEFEPYNSPMNPGGRPAKGQRSELGERIAQARERAGLSQYDLAKILGVTQGTVGTWERRVSELRTNTLTKLAQALNTSADELLGIKPPRESNPKGRLQNIIQEVSLLPRGQREKILEQFENTLAGQKLRQQLKEAS